MKLLVRGGGVCLGLLALLALQAVPVSHEADAAPPVVVPADIFIGAELVANATVAHQSAIEVGSVPHTLVTLHVGEQLKGKLPTTVTVLVAGGRARDGRTVWVSHTPSFRTGSQVQVALRDGDHALADKLVELNVIASPFFAVYGGERGVADIGDELIASAAGVDDFVTTPGLRWSTFSPPARYLVNTQGSGVARGATTAAVIRAAQRWEDDYASVIDLEYAGSTTKVGFDLGDGENVISFQHLPRSAFLAQTSWFVLPDGTYEFDTVLNTRYRFSDGTRTGHYDIETVVAHEIGHALGLGHPSGPGAAQEVMYPVIEAGGIKPLGAGDRAGVRSLYPPPIPVPPCDELEVTVDLNTGLGAPTEGDDVILGTPGPDWIWALGGDDIICGGSGIDRIFAGDGNDQVFGQGGSDRIWGQAGDDAIYAGAGADRVWAGAGNDIVFGQGGQDLLYGQAGADQLQGNWQSDTLHGGPGDDVLRGAGGKDALYGHGGNDSLFGGLNTDYLNGGDGVDAGDGQQGRDNPVEVDVSGCEQLESVSSC